MDKYQERDIEEDRKPGGECNRNTERMGLKVEAAIDRTKLIRKIQTIPATPDDGKNLRRFTQSSYPD